MCALLFEFNAKANCLTNDGGEMMLTQHFNFSYTKEFFPPLLQLFG